VNFFCIADEDTVRGFRLAGVAGRAVTTPVEAAQALAQAAAQPGLGILVLTQRVAAGIREEVDAFRWERDRPLLLEIPGPDGPLPTHKSLRQLVHSAVGIAVDQQGGS
jgi:V/A-type H+/Na+-transporting ATPase subunit F